MILGRKFFIFFCFIFGLTITGWIPAVADVENITESPETEDQIDIPPEDADIVASIMETEEDQKIVQYESFMLQMSWDNSDESYRKEIFEKISTLKNALKQNLDELSDNAKAAKENEQSLANRTLTAATTAATGLGAMELARGLAEQNADKAAAADMAAYIETFRCEYGNGNSVKGGPDAIELPGGNNQNMMNYRAQYIALAADLKERKDALGMKPGIESEEILDKTNLGLYDEENVGITGGTESSLYRAMALESESDQSKIDEASAASSRRVKGGAIAAGAGVVGGIIGNQILNHDKHDKSAEILAKRESIKQQLADVLQFEIDNCNAKIQESKEWAAEQKYNSEYKQNSGLRKLVSEIEEMEFIDNLEKLKDHPICD